MIAGAPTIPFFLMKNAKEFRGGKPPGDRREETAGLEGAVEKIQETISKYKAEGKDASELEIHLKALWSRLQELKGK